MILRIKVKGTFEAIVKRSETNRLSFRYLFIEFRSADEAAFALTAMDGFPFDARHTFKVNHFTDIERYAQLDETYIEPKAEDYQPRVCLSLFHGSQISKYLDKEHLRAWLGDPQGRDQYATFRGDEVEVHWHGKPSQCKLAYKHPDPNWTDLYVSWSPVGTYIVTLHRPGIKLWGGPSWKAQQRFAHPLVKLLDFSPCEQYLVTWSHDPIVVPEGALQGPQYFSPEDEVEIFPSMWLI
jgi:translation initiation factor 3 subunit B